ncbi:MAG TPA: hypothetical protein VGV92_05245 [Gammaproteobacteria bacterium]|nr:hypothetical protein [Gammaproteobacteria bacterium]
MEEADGLEEAAEADVYPVVFNFNGDVTPETFQPVLDYYSLKKKPFRIFVFSGDSESPSNLHELILAPDLFKINSFSINKDEIEKLIKSDFTKELNNILSNYPTLVQLFILEKIYSFVAVASYGALIGKEQNEKILRLEHIAILRAKYLNVLKKNKDHDLALKLAVNSQLCSAAGYTDKELREELSIIQYMSYLKQVQHMRGEINQGHARPPDITHLASLLINYPEFAEFAVAFQGELTSRVDLMTDMINEGNPKLVKQIEDNKLIEHVKGFWTRRSLRSQLAKAKEKPFAVQKWIEERKNPTQGFFSRLFTGDRLAQYKAAADARPVQEKVDYFFAHLDDAKYFFENARDKHAIVSAVINRGSLEQLQEIRKILTPNINEFSLNKFLVQSIDEEIKIRKPVRKSEEQLQAHPVQSDSERTPVSSPAKQPTQAAQKGEVILRELLQKFEPYMPALVEKYNKIREKFIEGNYEEAVQLLVNLCTYEIQQEHTKLRRRRDLSQDEELGDYAVSSLLIQIIQAANPGCFDQGMCEQLIRVKGGEAFYFSTMLAKAISALILEDKLKAKPRENESDLSQMLLDRNPIDQLWILENQYEKATHLKSGKSKEIKKLLDKYLAIIALHAHDPLVKKMVLASNLLYSKQGKSRVDELLGIFHDDASVSIGLSLKVAKKGKNKFTVEQVVEYMIQYPKDASSLMRKMGRELNGPFIIELIQKGSPLLRRAVREFLGADDAAIYDRNFVEAMQAEIKRIESAPHLSLMILKDPAFQFELAHYPALAETMIDNSSSVLRNVIRESGLLQNPNLAYLNNNAIRKFEADVLKSIGDSSTARATFTQDNFSLRDEFVLHMTPKLWNELRIKLDTDGYFKEEELEDEFDNVDKKDRSYFIRALREGIASLIDMHAFFTKPASAINTFRTRDFQRMLVELPVFARELKKRIQDANEAELSLQNKTALLEALSAQPEEEMQPVVRSPSPSPSSSLTAVTAKLQAASPKSTSPVSSAPVSPVSERALIQDPDIARIRQLPITRPHDFLDEIKDFTTTQLAKIGNLNLFDGKEREVGKIIDAVETPLEMELLEKMKACRSFAQKRASTTLLIGDWIDDKVEAIKRDDQLGNK